VGEAPVPMMDAEPPRQWGLGDAFLIAAMFVVSQLLGMLAAGGIVRMLGYDSKIAASPLVLLAVELVGYVFAFLCARVVITLKTGQSFLKSIEWNYPGAERLPQLLLLGLLLAVLVTFTTSFLPVPKGMPIEQYFNTRTHAITSMMFATLLAPAAEELYFRGIFFPALRRTLAEERSRRVIAVMLIFVAVIFATLAYLGQGGGYAMFAGFVALAGGSLLRFNGDAAAVLDEGRRTLIAVALTGMLFALVHGAQLSHAWGPLLMLTIVGIVLTAVRLRLNSVAASWILHTGYNGTLFLLMWSASAGFTKLS
jgi:uncharacterized protein